MRLQNNNILTFFFVCQCFICFSWQDVLKMRRARQPFFDMTRISWRTFVKQTVLISMSHIIHTNAVNVLIRGGALHYWTQYSYVMPKMSFYIQCSNSCQVFIIILKRYSVSHEMSTFFCFITLEEFVNSGSCKPYRADDNKSDDSNVSFLFVF